jgi:hypothetical protein
MSLGVEESLNFQGIGKADSLLHASPVGVKAGSVHSSTASPEAVAVAVVTTLRVTTSPVGVIAAVSAVTGVEPSIKGASAGKSAWISRPVPAGGAVTLAIARSWSRETWGRAATWALEEAVARRDAPRMPPSARTKKLLGLVDI